MQFSRGRLTPEFLVLRCEPTKPPGSQLQSRAVFFSFFFVIVFVFCFMFLSGSCFPSVFLSWNVLILRVLPVFPIRDTVVLPENLVLRDPRKAIDFRIEFFTCWTRNLKSSFVFFFFFLTFKKINS